MGKVMGKAKLAPAEEGTWVTWDQDPEKICIVASNPKFTLDLVTLKPADKLLVTYGEDKIVMDFIIVAPATGHTNKNMAKALTFLSQKDRDAFGLSTTGGIEVLIGGSCNYRPGSFLGISSVTLGNVTIGRDMILWIDGTDKAMVRFAISKIQLIRQAEVVKEKRD